MCISSTFSSFRSFPSRDLYQRARTECPFRCCLARVHRVALSARRSNVCSKARSRFRYSECRQLRCSSSQSPSPKAPDLEAQKVPKQRPDSMREAGTPCRNSPSTLSWVAFSTRHRAANVSPPTTVSPPSRKRPESNSRPQAMRSAASLSDRPDGRAGTSTQHPNVSSVVRTRPTKLGSAVIVAKQSGHAAPKTST